MDPNANLKEQKALVEYILEADPTESQTLKYYQSTRRLAELAEAMDGWMKKGGFPPDAWKKDAAALVEEARSHPDLCSCDDTLHVRGFGCL